MCITTRKRGAKVDFRSFSCFARREPFRGGIGDQVWCGMGVVTPRGSNVIILTASASQMSGTSMWAVLELSSLGHSCQIGADMGECWLSLGYS